MTPSSSPNPGGPIGRFGYSPALVVEMFELNRREIHSGSPFVLAMEEIEMLARWLKARIHNTPIEVLDTAEGAMLRATYEECEKAMERGVL